MEHIEDHTQPPVVIYGIGPGNGKTRENIGLSETGTMIEHGETAMLFAYIATRCVEINYVRPVHESETQFESDHDFDGNRREPFDHAPLRPNRADVCVVSAGKRITYYVHTSVELPDGSRLQENDNFLEVKKLPAVLTDTALVDTHTGATIIDSLGRDNVLLSNVANVLKSEKNSLSGNIA